jgi:nitronate monooxygenase
MKNLNRRSFLRLTASATTAAAVLNQGVRGEEVKPNPPKPNPFRTRFCESFGIRFPIVQAGMSGVAGPELVAAVSNAGGLGILTGTLLPPDELRARIRRIKELTTLPFGVNLLMHSHLRPPKKADGIPRTAIHAMQSVLNVFREELSIPKSEEQLPQLPDMLENELEIILEEKVPVWSIGLGQPEITMVKECHKHGTRVMAMITTVEDAIAMAETGVDVIVAQGSDAGGHRSTGMKRESNQAAAIGTLSLVPQVVDAVKVPVLAAGGIVDGRGMLAAFSLGASGVLIGTRFIATTESIAPECHKQALLQSSSDTTMITDAFTGMYARVIRNRYVDAFTEKASTVLPPFYHYLAGADVIETAGKQGKAELYSLYAGQGAGLIRSTLTAAEVIERLMKELASAYEALRAKSNEVV